uniref:uncharacterized protein LOC109968535 n=1 Tax=Monopterus albus TaxID=43700 RepID=UPI0009B35137|nr:uncharacterized protein LOC109968535 [Monopterus albus]
MDELTDYLRSRHVPEEDIQRMEQDKIDSSVIRLMTDDQLSHYLPSYGDRLAVFGYCRRKDKDPSTRKSKLFERCLSMVFRQKGDREHVLEREHQTSLRNAQKNQRKIELGWMHFREGEFVQVRTKKGGGTRKESVPKGSKKQQLIEKAGQLFFPGGKNAEGNLTDFDIDLTDFQQHTLEDSITGEEDGPEDWDPVHPGPYRRKLKNGLTDYLGAQNRKEHCQDGVIETERERQM